eukprot:3191228-Pyramimonas_sp.AAC.1
MLVHWGAPGFTTGPIGSPTALLSKVPPSMPRAQSSSTCGTSCRWVLYRPQLSGCPDVGRPRLRG